MNIGIVIASPPNAYFLDQLRSGCDAATGEMTGATCTLRGGYGPLSPIIDEMVDQSYAAIAVAPTDPQEILSSLRRAKNAGIPVFTFINDLPDPDKALRLAHFGNDQKALGQLLGKMVRQFNKGGGTYCILHDPSSAVEKTRLEGITDVLTMSVPPGPMIPGSVGTAGWDQSPNCPMSMADSPAEAAKQVGDLLTTLDLDILILLNERPQEDGDLYAEAVGSFRNDIFNFDLGIFGYGTTRDQVGLVGKGLSTLQVGERPFKFGYDLGYAMIRVRFRDEVVVLDGDGKPIAVKSMNVKVEDRTPPIGFDVCRRDNEFECDGRTTAIQ
ncbi:MAG: hypothetical protein EOS34_28060 [Mesorhizobium sp.]|nr:MAG: hypothetical protein EOS34_28060 [Mesorhizobium sp.]